MPKDKLLWNDREYRVFKDKFVQCIYMPSCIINHSDITGEWDLWVYLMKTEISIALEKLNVGKFSSVTFLLKFVQCQIF